jgi:hypothetical protein
MNEPGIDDLLLEQLVALANRPYDFTLWAFPWGELGTELETREGPDPWQRDVLLRMQERLIAGETPNAVMAWAGEAIQVAIKSGHNVGKSALLSWIGWWAMSTAVDTRGRATANTEKQLRTILWAELSKWHGLFIAKQLFKVTATSIYSADPEHSMTWRMDAVPWSADNPDAFSGLHNYGKRIIILFDEASGIADSIWERTDGVMREMNTQLLWVAASNPSNNSGRFYECWHKLAASWLTRTVSSLEVTFTNKDSLHKAIAQHGIDSDYVKVRILGEFPSTSTHQLLSTDVIREARVRAVEPQPWEPLILGVDIARYGDNENVAQFRRGRDARTLPIVRWKGLSTVESGNRIAQLIAQHSPDAVYIDEGGVGGGVIDFLRHLGYYVIGVNFGAAASSRPGGILVANKRAEMYFLVREWLQSGGAIADADELEDQFIAVTYTERERTQETILTPKKEMLVSPDWADAVALTFAYPAVRRFAGRPAQVKVEYDPLAFDRVSAFDSPASREYEPEGMYH